MIESTLKWAIAGSADHLLTARKETVAILRLNRPESRNALSTQLFTDLVDQLELLDRDGSTRSIVIWGGDSVFAAGADIRDMAGRSVVEMHLRSRLEEWQRFRRVKLPVIAAVNGLALGGGNELALACDLVVAGESASFGQPEIELALIPGGGATQRLVRAVGKVRAMDVILTGSRLGAADARRAGLVSRVVPDELCLAEALKMAMTIAALPPLAVRMAKEAVLAAFEMPLSAGLDFERRLFELLFSTADAQEGLSAFVEKRRPNFQGE
ncbi:enoyl-CoA hydratase [soil metagenome]